MKFFLRDQSQTMLTFKICDHGHQTRLTTKKEIPKINEVKFLIKKCLTTKQKTYLKKKE